MNKKLLLSVVLFAAWMPGQDAGEAALARARVIAEQEGDLRAAQQAYREVIDGKGADGVKAEAALRLGSMLWRLEKKDEARVWLEKAAAAGGEVGAAATAVMQGKAQGEEQDKAARAEAVVKKLVELLHLQYATEVAANLPSGFQDALSTTISELRWLGEPGARAIVIVLRSLSSEIEPRRSAAGEYGTGGAVLAYGLANQLWHLGTPTAEAYLREVAAKGDLPWRQLVAQACGDAAPDLLSVAALFLRDSDPDGDVQRGVMRLAARFDPETLKAMLSDPLPRVRTAGLSGIAGAWESATAETRDSLVSSISASLHRSLHDQDLNVTSAGWEVAKAFLHFGPRAARRLVLQDLGSWPTVGPKLDNDVNALRLFHLDDDELALLVQAAKQLGPCPVLASRSDSTHWFIIGLLAWHQAEWSEAGVGSLIDLLDLGYAMYAPAVASWSGRAITLAQPAMLARLVSALPKVGRADEILTAIAQLDLPVEVFASARNVIEREVVNPSPRTSFEVWKDGQRQVRGNNISVQECGRSLYWMLSIVGATGSPDAPDWLVGLVDKYPVLADQVIEPLVRLSVSGVDEPALAAMRKLLVWEGTPEVELRRPLRGLLFGELARRGDNAAIPLFPLAYARGLGPASHPVLDGRSFPHQPAQGVRARDAATRTGLHLAGNGGCLPFLGPLLDANGQVRPPWHSYDADHLVLAWRTLLQSDQRETVLAELSTLTRVQPEVLPLIAASLHDLVVQNTNPQLVQRAQSVARLFLSVEAADVADGGPLRDSLVAALREPKVAPVLLNNLKPEVVRVFATEALAALTVPDSQAILVGVVTRAGIPIPTPILLSRLADRYSRQYALMFLPNHVEASVQRAIEKLVVDDDVVEIRVAACAALARLLATDSVAPLLQALRDPAENVRKAAAEALQSIRFYQDQQSHWQQVQSGVEVTKETAAAKLVLQAKTGAKDQRILAIRSLAVLAAPETLPYLIEWTQDKDAEIAQAARDATAAIHQKAGVPK